MRLQHLEDDELGEGVEATDEVVLLQHLSDHPEHQGPGGALRVVQVLQQHPEHRPEVLDDHLGVAGPDHPDDARHRLSPLVPAPSSDLDTLQGRDQLIQLRLLAFSRLRAPSLS